jgi:anti-anti-sigma factor
MKIERSAQDGVTVLSPVGRIDTTTSSMLANAMQQALDDGTRDVLVDLSGTDYISSAGLRVFLGLEKRLGNRRGRLVLCGMGQPVRQVFQLAGAMPSFTVETTRRAALLRFAATEEATATVDIGVIGPIQP